ncbi:MAG: hypothetical protein KDK44_03920 [Chlamydiia bacterium]|nr:hypothetical protein [Chlamydiia bacterium]MCP5509183.1 hypothetical protein [Chlamydiales bacterium]
MSPDEMETKIAKLESVNDQLQAEFDHLDMLLREIGFAAGIETLKEAAKELLDKNKDPSDGDA